MKYIKILCTMLLVFLLTGCSANVDGQESSAFLPEGVTMQKVNVNSGFFQIELPDKMDLCINQISEFDEGILYEIKLDYDEGFPERIEEGVDRLHLGYFYTEGDRIFRIRSGEVDELQTWSPEKLKEEGSLVCSPVSVEDENIGEKGFHEKLEVTGDTCKYTKYNDAVETGFYEHITWERGKGIISYNCGYGAMRDHLGLLQSENTTEDSAIVQEMEDAYHEFLNGERTVYLYDENGEWLLNAKGNYMEFSIWRLPKLLKENTCRYLYMDIDGDGFEELHIKGMDRAYYIFKYQDGELKKFFYNDQGDCCPVHQGDFRGILCSEKSEDTETLMEIVYSLSVLNENGEWVLLSRYICTDANRNGEADDTDLYWREDTEGMVSAMGRDEWKAEVDSYLENAVSWDDWSMKERTGSE